MGIMGNMYCSGYSSEDSARIERESEFRSREWMITLVMIIIVMMITMMMMMIMMVTFLSSMMRVSTCRDSSTPSSSRGRWTGKSHRLEGGR